ncbi:induced during granule regeneration 1 precursor, putative, partial [Ichthyophthirius multifiliis]
MKNILIFIILATILLQGLAQGQTISGYKSNQLLTIKNLKQDFDQEGDDVEIEAKEQITFQKTHQQYTLFKEKNFLEENQIEQVYEDKFKGIQEFSLQGWFRVSRSANRQNNAAVYQLNQNLVPEDKAKVGDRVLALHMQQNVYSFTTYDLATNNPAVLSTITIMEENLSKWQLIYHAYSDIKQKAYIFAQFPNQDPSIIHLNQIQHQESTKYILWVGQTFTYSKFPGKINSLVLCGGVNCYKEKTWQQSKPITVVIPNPVNPLPQPVDPQSVNPLPQPVDHLPQPVNPLPQPVNPLPQPVDPLPQPQPIYPLSQPVDSLPQTVDSLPQPQPVDPLPQPVNPLPQPVDPQPQPVDPLPQPVNPLPQPVDPLPQPIDPLPQPQPVDHLPQPLDPLPQPVDPLPQPVNPLPQPQPVDPLPQPQPVDPLPQPQPVDPLPQPVNPLPQPVNPLPQPVDPLPLPQPQPQPQPVDPLPQPVNPLPQPVDPLPQLVDPLPQSVNPLPQPVDHLPQPLDPLSQPVDSLPQSVDPLPQPVYPLSQPVDSLPQTVDSLTQSVDSLPQSVDNLPQPVDPLPQPVNPLNQPKSEEKPKQTKDDNIQKQLQILDDKEYDEYKKNGGKVTVFKDKFNTIQEFAIYGWFKLSKNIRRQKWSTGYHLNSNQKPENLAKP